MNSIYVRDFQMPHVAEEAAQFLHQACRGLLHRSNGNHCAPEPEHHFYTRVLEHALGYFGSRVLCPARPSVRESDLYSLYSQSQEEIEEKTIYSYAEYMHMIDFLVLHKDYESNSRRYLLPPALMQEGVGFTGEKFEYTTRRLGYMLGSELYDAYLAGRVSKRFLRSLFYRNLNHPGSAREAYFAVSSKIRRIKTGTQRKSVSGRRPAQKRSCSAVE
jgi:hypothetical protein